MRKKPAKMKRAWALLHPCSRYDCALTFTSRKAARDYKRANEYFDHRVARVEIREIPA